MIQAIKRGRRIVTFHNSLMSKKLAYYCILVRFKLFFFCFSVNPHQQHDEVVRIRKYLLYGPSMQYGRESRLFEDRTRMLGDVMAVHRHNFFELVLFHGAFIRFYFSH